MAFVKRETTKEEAEELKKVAPRNPINSNWEPWFFTQVYDKERNILLVDLGGSGSLTDERQVPNIFLFLWNDDVCCIEAFSDYGHVIDKSIDLVWYIEKIHAPIQLESKKNELIDLIKEAFLAYGFGGSSWKVNSVLLKKIEEPGFGGETGWRYGGF